MEASHLRRRRSEAAKGIKRRAGGGFCRRPFFETVLDCGRQESGSDRAPRPDPGLKSVAAAISAPPDSETQMPQEPTSAAAPKTPRRPRKTRPTAPASDITANQTSPAITPPGGKLGIVVTLLRRPDGASITDLMGATGWQAHSVRGAIAGAIKKKLGLPVLSTKSEAGRVYRIEAIDDAA